MAVLKARRGWEGHQGTLPLGQWGQVLWQHPQLSPASPSNSNQQTQGVV